MKNLTTFTKSAGLAMLLGACMTFSANLSTAQSMFLNGVTHPGHYASQPIDKEPKVKWKFKTGGYVNSSGAIDDNKVYFGSADGNLYCLDINSGNVVWQFKTGGEINGSPAVIQNTVYFGSYDGNFYALNSTTGKVKWTFKTAGEKRFSAPGIHGNQPRDSVFVDPWDFWQSSPLVSDNTVYFGTGSGYFYALNTDTGKEKWKFKTEGVVHSSPALALGNIYFGSWDTFMYALNAKSGKLVWKFQTGADFDIYNQTGITSSPTVSGNMLYFGCRDSKLYALNAVTGAKVWSKHNNRGWISVTPVIVDDKVIYTSGSDKKYTVLNKNTGDSIFRSPIQTGVFSSAAITGETVYFGDMDGLMYARNINTGEKLWSFEVDGSRQDEFKITDASHVVQPSLLQAAAAKNKGIKTLMQLRLSVGSILTSPVIKDQVLYFGSTDGTFYALQ